MAYLFCVLAPSLSFAFAGGPMEAPCIVEDHGPAMLMREAAIGRYVHDGGMLHDHSHHMPMANDDAKVQKDAGLPAKGPHKHGDPRCCGLVSISAIPAAEIVIVMPTAPSSRCAIETYRDAADNAPPGLYRPPIS